MIMDVAVSIEAALRSFILVSAICWHWALVILATFFLLGSPDAVSMPQAFLIRTGAGGVLVINVNERSA